MKIIIVTTIWLLGIVASNIALSKTAIEHKPKVNYNTALFSWFTFFYLLIKKASK